MARKVFISSDMSIDETISDIAEMDELAALIWPWILTYFDDWGRAKASPREIKNSVFPANGLVSIESIGKALKIYDGRLVRLYEVEGKPYMCIDPDKWFKYQTHIRSEKRDNDRSKHPAPPASDSAHVRADARECAQFADNLTNCIPSPSPSPSFSLSTTTGESTDQIHLRVFGRTLMSALMQQFIVKVKSEGFEDTFVQELMLEAGETSNGPPSLRYMHSIFDRWKLEGIYSRAQSKQQREKGKPPGKPTAPDKELEYRRIEIARNKWIAEGNDPDEFVYNPGA